MLAESVRLNTHRETGVHPCSYEHTCINIRLLQTEHQNVDLMVQGRLTSILRRHADAKFGRLSVQVAPGDPPQGLLPFGYNPTPPPRGMSVTSRRASKEANFFY